MRRIAQFILLIVLLLLSTNAQLALSENAVKNIEAPSSVETRLHPTQDLGENELSRPVLINVTDSSVLVNPVKERNDTLGNGAIFPAQINNTVEILYAVINSNSDTDVRLYADAPYTNKTGAFTLDRSGLDNESIPMVFLFTEVHNFTLPYIDDPTEIVNATVGYFRASLNVTSDYLRFFAAITGNGKSETDSSAPYNMLTTDLYWETTSQDSFYIQDDEILINLVANNSDTENTYGIRYKLSTSSTYTDANFTDVLSANLEDQLNLGTFAINNQLEWRSYVYVNDTERDLIRRIEGLEIKFVSIDDGTPSISSFISSESEDAILRNEIFYSNINTINFNFSATVPKGNISQFELVLGGGNETIIPATGNVSTQGDFYNLNHTYTEENKFNVSILARTNKDLFVFVNYTIVIDAQPPTRGWKEGSEDQEIKSFDGKVTFSFTYEDENSGIRFVYLDFGDGFSKEVTGLESYTHTYLLPENSITYQVILTVIDWAGNENNIVTTVTIIPSQLDQTSPPTLEVWIFVILLIGGIALYFGRDRFFSS